MLKFVLGRVEIIVEKNAGYLHFLLSIEVFKNLPFQSHENM